MNFISLTILHTIKISKIMNDNRCVHLSMNHLRLFVAILFLFFHVEAQYTSTNPHVPKVHQSRVAIICGILSIIFSVTFLIVAYSKFCHTAMPTPHSNLGELVIRSRSRFSGIDRAVIESLPFFRFSSLKVSKQGLECVVCLSEFEDTEVLWLLPKCRHAFRMNCIDNWLESHSSCPLYRYKFDEVELMNCTYTNSLRYTGNPSNLLEDPNLEFIVQRSSSRFDLGNSFRKFEKPKKDLLVQEGDIQKLFHKFKHKIIISDIVYTRRWSDLNFSDLTFLNSEMISIMSSERFNNAFSMNEHVMKIKEDLEMKRLYESKFGKMNRSNSFAFSSSSFPSTSNNEGNQSTISRLLSRGKKGSMSEITNLSRFREFSVRKRSGESESSERMRAIWLPIARRTVQWFAGRERSLEGSESERQPSYV